MFKSLIYLCQRNRWNLTVDFCTLMKIEEVGPLQNLRCWGRGGKQHHRTHTERTRSAEGSSYDYYGLSEHCWIPSFIAGCGGADPLPVSRPEASPEEDGCRREEDGQGRNPGGHRGGGASRDGDSRLTQCVVDFQCFFISLRVAKRIVSWNATVLAP